MKCVAVSLETLDPEGVEIVSDVTDSLGVIYIGNRHDASRKRDFLSLELVRIT